MTGGTSTSAEEPRFDNPAAVLYGIEDLRYENFPLPDKPAEGCVRVDIKSVGICGSDVHYMKKVCAANSSRGQSKLSCIMQ